MRPTIKRILSLIGVCLLCAGTNILTYGQNATPSPANLKTELLEKEIEADKEKIKELTQSTEELKRQSAVATKQLDTLFGIFIFVAGLITVVMGLGTITSFMSWKADRVRSSKLYDLSLKHDEDSSKREAVVHKMQDELYSLFLKKEQDTSVREKLIQERQDLFYDISIRREQETSERDRHIFIQSTETLTLVNQTLELAKEASERASKSLKAKLDRRHDELEREAVELIDESKAYKNFKVLVEDSNARSNLLTLAIEINGLQNNQNILDEDVALHPNCCFIRGMEFHLNQHFKSAIKYWKQAKDHPQVTDTLKVMSLFWIGYEQNNKGEFENAASNFEVASSVAKGAMRYEFERIKIESKFFNTEKYKPEQIVPEMEALYEQVKAEKPSDEMQKAKSAIAGTLGNIYYQRGEELSNTNKEEAGKYYLKAKQTFADAPTRNKWNWFGYGEACFRLGEITEAAGCFRNKVKPEAEFEYSTRPEPRTKVLGQTTVLICSIRTGLEADIDPLYNLIKTTLGSVDDRVTIYSQFQRRNVSKGVFLKDLNKAMAEFNELKGVNPDAPAVR